VTERKQDQKFVARSPGDARSASLNKDKPAATKNNEKKSAEKIDSRNTEKKSDQLAETKTLVKREKTVAQPPKALKPSPTPTPSPKPSPAPVAVTPTVTNSVPKGEDTFMLEVCAVSGLLPVRGLCKNTARHRFKLGGEPTKFCNASHH
jgi:hypothetical protein